MTLFLVRHGHETDGFRGGWSSLGLDGVGLEQSARLAEHFAKNQSEYRVEKIYSSDLTRAVQTARFISQALAIPVITKSEFREVNNGALAGMDNKAAEMLYPDLYWKNLEWDEKYPNGESPREFYERVSAAWSVLISAERENAVLVTHGGVLQVIFSILKREKFSNKKSFVSVSCCDIIRLDISE